MDEEWVRGRPPQAGARRAGGMRSSRARPEPPHPKEPFVLFNVGDIGDLAAAKSQNEAMSKAKTSLQDAVSKAVKANKGYKAVSAMPSARSRGAG